MKRILVTGGAGFIGSHLCDALLERGHTVVCVDNLSTGRRDNIRHLKKNRKFVFIPWDVTQELFIEGKRAFHAVLHFASPASPRDYLERPIQTLKVGALGTHNMLGLAKAHGARFLLASTSEVYGDPQEHPQKETYWGHVNPVGPRGVYDEAKRFAEAITMAYNRVHKVKVRIARIFNTYGPRMQAHDGRAVPEFITAALAGKPLEVYGSGNQTRSFCYITDTVTGILRLLNSSYTGPVNIGNEDEITIMQLAKAVLDFSGSKSRIIRKPLPVDDPKVRQPDPTLAFKVLNWGAEVGLGRGLKQTIAWFKSQPRR